ncbi:MAG: efflux RND transporter periplasmic adaptor subunit [Bacteroidales bacterium]
MNSIKKILEKRMVHYFLIGIVGLLSGMLIFGGQNTHPDHGEHELEETEPGVWTCSMHPQIKMDKPGKCPICAMDLIPLRMGGTSDNEKIDPNAIQLSEEAIALANIRTTPVVRNNGAKKIRLYGKITSDERSLQSQTAHVSGRIESLKVDFTGQPVRKGESLGTIYSPDLLNAQQELLVALNTKQPLLIDATREKLRNWKMTDSQIAAIEQSGKVSPIISIQATVNGVVLAKKVNVGDYVSQGGVLFDIANLSRVWGVFDAYETDLPFLQLNEEVNFTLQALPGKQFKGKISFIDPIIDPVSRTARIRVDLNNPNMELKPEMYATAEVNASLSQYQDELVIPQSAVLWTGKRSVVYVRQTGIQSSAFMLREVTLGPALQNLYVVTDGLEEGEEIVMNGVFTVDANAQLEGKRSMMNQDTAKDVQKSGLEIQTLEVQGSCGMCKERIQNAALSVTGVKRAEWEIKTKQLQVEFDSQATNMDAVSKAIAHVGHDTAKDSANADVYEQLPGCCLYR